MYLNSLQMTATQAMVEMKEGQSLDNGFTLTVSLAEIHVPRMIIENHPDDPESKQVCNRVYCTNHVTFNIALGLSSCYRLCTRLQISGAV